jgi:hypothetical protein
MQNLKGVARRSILGDACSRGTEEARDNDGGGGGDGAEELAKVVDTLRRGSGELEGTKAQPNKVARIAFWEDVWVGATSGCWSSTIDEGSGLEVDDIYNETAEQRALTCDCV